MSGPGVQISLVPEFDTPSKAASVSELFFQKIGPILMIFTRGLPWLAMQLRLCN